MINVYEERGFARGIEQGIEQGIERGIERGIAEGIERGIAVGIEQGIQRGQRELLLKLLQARFGVLSERQVARVRTLSPQELEPLSEALLTATALEQLAPFLGDAT